MNIYLVIDNSTTRIHGVHGEMFSKLRRDVSHFDMSKYLRTGKRNADICYNYLIDRDGQFPTGLLPYVINFLDKNSLVYHLVDNRLIPKSKVKGLSQLTPEPSPYPPQKEAVQAALNSTGRGISVLPTGTGKTRTLKDMILAFGHRALVIPPSKNLKTQVYEYLASCFGERHVQFYERGCQPKAITVMNFHAIKSEDPEFFDDFDMYIFDEFHHAKNNTIRGVDQTHLSKIYYKFGMTATDYTNDPYESILLNSVLSQRLYSMKTIDAVRGGYINQVVPIFKRLQNASLSSTGNYQKDMPIFIDKNDERNDFVVKQSKKILDMKIPQIILVKHIAHGRELSKLIPDSIFINGQDGSSKKNMDVINRFNNLEYPIVIGTDVIGEGVDTKACGAMFNLAGGKAKSVLMQRAGRSCRTFPNQNVGFYFDFYDVGSKPLFKHSKARAKILGEEYCIGVNEV